MGLQDRDYMHERHRRQSGRELPFRPPPRRSFLLPLLFWIALAAAGFKFAEHWQSNRAARAAQPPLHTQAEREPPADDPAEAARPSSEAVAAPPVRNPPTIVHAAPAPLETAPAAPRTTTTGGTIYHCKDYSGGTFWSQAPCSQHRALIDRIASVPAGIPFDQQVEIAEQARQSAIARTMQATRTYAPSPDPALASKAACNNLDVRVEQLDGMARQPQSASMQDWIRSERQKARDAQFRLRC